MKSVLQKISAFFVAAFSILLLLGSPALAQQHSNTQQGAVLGGYGELHYNDVTSGKPASQSAGKLDFHRFVLFAGYNFNDWISFHSELELEHTLLEAEDGEAVGGEVALEQAYVNLRYRPEFGVRAGVMLVPVGIVNPVHEPPSFNGVERPNVEKYIIPSTWRESGVGVFGKFRNGLSYQAYVMAGLKAGSIEGEEGIRESRQSALESSMDNIALTGRLDYMLNLNLKLGASYYYSNLATDAVYGDALSGAHFQMVEGHVIYTHKAFEARGLFALSSVSEADKLNAQFGNDAAKGQYGGYVELAYDLLSFSAEPTEQRLFAFGRYESYDTNYRTTSALPHNDEFQREDYTFGLTYKPAPRVAFKADYQFLNNAADKRVQQFNLGVGYNF